jgi:hypothetical protein
MNLAVAIYSAILFFLLSPGVLLRLPPNGSKLTVAVVHAVVFAGVLYFTVGFIWRWSLSIPVLREGAKNKKNRPNRPFNF